MSDTEDTKKSKRPSNSKLKQQKLPAWQPIMTAGTVLPIFFAIGIAFIPLGVALLITSNNVQEKIIDYTTKCEPSADIRADYDNCADFLEDKNNTGRMCPCIVEFDLEEDFRGQVYMYYGLTNYYQNHRRYVKSRDDQQLLGNKIDPDDLTSDCEPYRKENKTHGFAPCGAIANSFFNDSFNLMFLQDHHGDDYNETVGLNGNDIAWDSDKEVKFDNPSSWTDYVKPENWPVPVWELDPDDSSNNGYNNEDLIVWMRTAALPTFRKLYRKLDRAGTFNEGLPKGRYQLNVNYSYPVTSFDGTKRMILTTTSWLGGKNPFLGIAYLVVGSVCVVIGVVFLVIHLKIGKKPLELVQNVSSSTSY